MGRAQEHVLDRSGLHDLAAVHHGDPVGEVGDDAHVVGDQQDPGTGLGGEPAQQVEDLGLHRDVQCGGRLVGDQQGGVVGDGHRDDHALALPAGELEGVGRGPLLRFGYADLAQESDGLGGGVLGGYLAVVADHLGDLSADPGQRIERGGRLLEHHGGGPAAQRREVALAGADHLGARDEGAAGGTGVAGQQAHRGQRDGGLAGARLADEGERLAGFDVQGDTPDGRYLTGLGGEDDAEVVEFENRPGLRCGGALGDGHPRPLTSNASRSPSPIALNAHTTRMMARPGGMMSHQ